MTRPAALPPGARLWRLAGSLRLTVALLAIGMVLVFVGTLAQAQIGIDRAITVFFRSWFVPVAIPGLDLALPLLPGGWTLGALLLANLIAGQTLHLKKDWRELGLWMTHGSILLLLAGEFATGLLQQEWVMVLDEGATRAHVEAYKESELALRTPAPNGAEKVAVLRQSALRDGAQFALPDSGLTVRVLRAVPHAGLVRPRDGAAGDATQGAGKNLRIDPRAFAGAPGAAPEPAALIELSDSSGPLGTWIVSPRLLPQPLSPDSKATVELRPRRLYLPFAITLDDFLHEKHPGTEIPSKFASRVRLATAGGERPVLISMNEPLRWDGWTFYQHSFANADRTSILHAVRNPARALPYISCAIGGLGLALHFLIRLARARPARAGATPTCAHPPGRQRALWIPAAACALPLLLAAAGLVRPDRWNGLPLETFLRQPVLADGRVKPLDTVARSALLLIHGKATLRDGAQRLSAGAWLAEMLFNFDAASARPVFRVEDPEILDALGLPRQGPVAVLSLNQLDPVLDKLSAEARAASAVEGPRRSRYQRGILKLFRQAQLFLGLTPSLVPDPGAVAFAIAPDAHRDMGNKDARARQARAWDSAAAFRAIPPSAPGEGRAGWATTGQALARLLDGEPPDAALARWTGIAAAARAGDAPSFTKFAGALDNGLADLHPNDRARAKAEAAFNRINPFGAAMIGYLLAAVAVFLFWFQGAPWLRRAGFGLAFGALLLTTAGLAARMLIEGRPPVTNLYSSAVFVGWAAAILGLVLERADRSGTGVVVAGAAGFAGLIIAHHLALSGDTMEMMRAVLDSNFWLATHVVVITLGYSAAFAAGLAAALAILRSLAGRPPAASDEAMCFGAVCFALLLSFVGTVLGGIWADQSWGRFWGWDPKENGALLIVLWNALILHARPAGLAGRRGTLALAVGGNIITAWSWFGTNMLGIGLHSYGFTDAAFAWLMAFAASQIALIFAAFIQTTPPPARA